MLSKEVIKEGKGETPKAGDNVSAHYVGKLPDGSDFDSSKKRGRPFQFPIGQGRVIKGCVDLATRPRCDRAPCAPCAPNPRPAPLCRWDVGIATMSRGEVSVFRIAPEYGYGKAGAGGVIPPNATLLFEVELLDFI
jgi:FKBP-type peptidyl-prolyl cis-trans isomerase